VHGIRLSSKRKGEEEKHSREEEREPTGAREVVCVSEKGGAVQQQPVGTRKIPVKYQRKTSRSGRIEGLRQESGGGGGLRGGVGVVGTFNADLRKRPQEKE